VTVDFDRLPVDMTITNHGNSPDDQLWSLEWYPDAADVSQEIDIWADNLDALISLGDAIIATARHRQSLEAASRAAQEPGGGDRRGDER
jgi:hypothetical protein